MAQEKMLFNIPAESKWHTDDVEKKAKELGLSSKSELMLKAVDLMMNFDTEFIKKTQAEAEQLNISLWLYIQNKFIKDMAIESADFETGICKAKILDEYRYINEGGNKRIITGEELFDEIKKERINKIKLSPEYNSAKARKKHFSEEGEQHE